MTLQELRERPTLTFREVQFVLGNCSRSTIYRYMKKGLITPPAKPTQRRALFDAQEIFALIQPHA